MTQTRPPMPAPAGPAAPGGEVPARLHDRTIAGLYALALRITGSTREAEDVVEQTLVEAARADPARASELRFETLVRRCRELALVRSGKRSIAAVRQRRLDPPRAGAPRGEPRIDTDAVRSAAVQALERLGVQERIVLEMVYFEGYTRADVAASLRCTPQTARAHLRRACASYARLGRARVLIGLSAPSARPAPSLGPRLLAAIACGE